MSSKPSDTASEHVQSENPASGSGPGDDSAAASVSPDGERNLASIPEHHETLFKTVFSEPAHAAELLRAILPLHAAAHFDWNSFELDRASLDNESFEQLLGGLLFRARLIDARQVLVWLLFEHLSPPQSMDERRMSRRMTEMIFHLLDDWLPKHPDARYLPAVLPVVLCQGNRPGTAPTVLLEPAELSDQARRDLGPHLLSLRCVLDEPRVVHVGEIDTRGMTPVPRLTLGIMKHYRNRSVVRYVIEHAEDIRALYATEHGRLWLSRVLPQIWQVNPYIDRNLVIYFLLAPLLGHHIEHVSELEQILRPIDRMLARGPYDRAFDKGQRACLLRLLVRRFGNLPTSLIERVASAYAEEIEYWFERAVGGMALDEVFATPPVIDA